MSVLFDRDRTVITRHINNIYKEGEFDEKSTCAKNAQVQIEDAYWQEEFLKMVKEI